MTDTTSPELQLLQAFSAAGWAALESTDAIPLADLLIAGQPSVTFLQLIVLTGVIRHPEWGQALYQALESARGEDPVALAAICHAADTLVEAVPISILNKEQRDD